jgi:hypothetical protein
LTLEPVEPGEPFEPAGKRAIPSQISASVRALVDSTLQRVFDRPYDVRNADDFERVMAEGGGAMSLASAGAIATVIARATPWIERALPWARKGAATGKVVPAARWATYAVPIALQLTSTIRHGVRELQVVASYVIHVMHEAGIEPTREFVAAVTLSLALEPDRQPDLSLTPARAAPGLVRRWILRSLGKDSASAARQRARADLAAIERLDLPALADEWAARSA